MTQITSLENNLECSISRPAHALIAFEQASRRAFLCVLLLLFIVSTALTVFWCNSMSAMKEMSMPGGWTMSMTWMRMPGQTWVNATVSFVKMWVVMMVAMMLPSLTPTLWCYHQSVGKERETLRGWLTTLVGLGYFFVWALLGLAVFPIGVWVATIEMEHRALASAVPITATLFVLIAGAFQFTKWKAHQLASCREALGRNGVLSTQASEAWRLGLHFGFRCILSCANLTAALLVFGVMDLRAMALVTVAITSERLAPASERVARIIGGVVVGIGCLVLGKLG